MAAIPQLTEEEKIARKVKIRRTISYIFGACAFVAIIVFVIFAMGTKKNINVKTAMDSQEVRSKLKQIINLENQYFSEHGSYVNINFMTMSKEIPQYNPNLDGSFKYKFDSKTGIATGIENEQDVNLDKDSSDGLTLSVKWEADVTEGSHFFWTDEDKADFKQKAAETPAAPAPGQAPASYGRGKEIDSFPEFLLTGIVDDYPCFFLGEKYNGRNDKIFIDCAFSRWCGSYFYFLFFKKA